MQLPSTADIVIVGAGIVGLGHAFEAWQRGARVLVVEQSTELTGASVRNFGHACITPQVGDAARFADVARSRWLDLAHRAGFFARESGTTVVARRPEEMDLLVEYAAGRDDTRLLTPAEVTERAGITDEVLGGAFLERDLQVDPREAAPAIAHWLASVGVRFAWRTTFLGVSAGVVSTSRGDIAADRVVVAVNHDVDRLYPALAEQARIERCHLHMLRVGPDVVRLKTPLFTGWSLLRYRGFAQCESATALRERLAADLPLGIELDLNQMYTSPPDGSLIVGDTHLRSSHLNPFAAQEGYEFLLDETRRLFGTAKLEVIETWQGIYATAPDTEFLIAEPEPGVQVVTVTTGIGMTTGLGIAPFVLDGAFEHLNQSPTPTFVTR